MVKARTEEGLSLYATLVVLVVLAFLAAAVTGLFTANLNLTQVVGNSQTAFGEAEWAVNQAIYGLAEDWTLTPEIQGSATSAPGSRAYHRLTFQTGGSYPYSTSNQSDTAVVGYGGRTIPPGHVHLLATGYCRGQYRTIEALVDLPPFPYAVALSGALDAPGPMWVEGVTDPQLVPSGQYDRPGHVAANSSQGIRIGGDPSNPTYISGFVRSPGTITLDPSAVVLGGLKPGSSAIGLPDLDILAFDTALVPGSIQLSQSSYPAGSLPSGIYRANALTYSGRLSLQDAFVYVEGDLNLDQGIEGNGAVVVDGDVTVSGSPSQLMGTNQVAILATGKITITGQGVGSSFFQGLLYSETAIDASNITVVGNVVGNSSDPNQGNALLDNVRLVSNPGASQLTFAVGQPATSLPGGGYNIMPGYMNNGQIMGQGAGGESLFEAGTLNVNPNFGGTLFLGEPTGMDPNQQYGYDTAVQNQSDIYNSSAGTGNNTVDLSDVIVALGPGQVQLGSLQGPGGSSPSPEVQAASAALQQALDAVAANPNSAAAAASLATAAQQFEDAILLGTSEQGWSVSSAQKTYDLSFQNAVLPLSDRLHIKAWRVHHQRL